MYNVDTELLFPLRVIPSLKILRGEDWQELVERVTDDDGEISDRFAFVLMMVRMTGCVSCNTHSFRAMRGCTQCAQQAIRRFRGTDQNLLEQFEQSKTTVEEYFENRVSGERIKKR